MDADVIKTYVELGMGVGIVAGIAFEAERDSPPARGRRRPSVPSEPDSRLGLRRGALSARVRLRLHRGLRWRPWTAPRWTRRWAPGGGTAEEGQGRPGGGGGEPRALAQLLALAPDQRGQPDSSAREPRSIRALSNGSPFSPV